MAALPERPASMIARTSRGGFVVTVVLLLCGGTPAVAHPAGAPATTVSAGAPAVTNRAATAAGACPTPEGSLTPAGEESRSTLTRRDGRVDEFMVAGGTQQSSLRVWYRPQLAPAGGYGCWQRISDIPASPKAGKRYVLAVEDIDGRLEAFFDEMGTYTIRLYQSAPDGPWTEEEFSVQSPPYWGVPSVFTHLDGRLGFVQSSRHESSDGSIGIWYTAQVAPAGAWGSWRLLDGWPYRSGPASPRTAVAADGTVQVTAQMWGAPSCVARIDQLPDGTWTSWRPAASSGEQGCPRR